MTKVLSMQNLTLLSAGEYLTSQAVMTLPSAAPNNSGAMDFVDRTKAQLASSADYGFSGDSKDTAVRRICSTLGLPFKLPEDIEHPEATMSLLADLVQLGAMKTCEDEDGSTVYQWIPAIEAKWRHSRFVARSINQTPKIYGYLKVSPSLVVENATLAWSLSPRHFKWFAGSTGSVYVCYVPDLEGQLKAMSQGKTAAHKEWEKAPQTSPGLYTQNWFAEVAKHLGTNYDVAVPITRHVYVTNNPHRLAEVLHAALPAKGELGRYWYSPQDETYRFVPPKADDKAGKQASKLEALLAA